jgi:prepilin-type N-terminal cleavage/methylation domain-containing protein
MRAGLTLIEMVVSLTVFGVLIAMALPTAARMMHAQAVVHGDGVRAAAIDDALSALARHVQGTDAAAGHLVIARDTVLDAYVPIGRGVVCQARGDTLWLARGDSLVPWSPQLRRDAGAGDRVVIMSDSGAVAVRNVRSAGSAPLRCGDADHPWPGVSLQRLVLDSVIGASPGAPIRLLARERWTLQRSGDGTWSLALATWDAARTGFVTAQPVAGPLTPPADARGPGFSVQARAGDGRVLRDSLSLARTLTLVLRTRRDVRLHPVVDSVVLTVAAP